MTHSLQALIRQRLFATACGYSDGNDVARQANDPLMNLLSGRDPRLGGALASKPMLSRFENAARAPDCFYRSINRYPELEAGAQ